MYSIKRACRELLDRATNVRVVRPGTVGILFEVEHLKQFFHRFRVDCVFDVGANAGQYAEMLRNKVRYNGPIISFEPIPKLAQELTIKARDDKNWYVVEAALDQTEGTKHFNIMTNDQFSSLLSPRHREVKLFSELNKVAQTIIVTTSTLAHQFKKFHRDLSFSRPFLKMDTQGNDLAVARGGENILNKFVGIQSELSVKPIYEGTEDYVSAVKYFQSVGFELSAFVPNNEGHFPQLIEIDCILVRRDLIP